MAQGGDALESNTSHAQLYEDKTSTFVKFLNSPTWLYPITRFLGHALHYYRYDIDFLGQLDVEDEERNWILYESYCDLVGCLLNKYCKEYDTRPSRIINEVLQADTEPKSGLEVMNVRSFNFIRATHGVLHFGYMFMSYCSLYKVKCCEDIAEEMKQMRVVDSQMGNWQGLWKYLHEEMIIIAKKQKRIEKIFRNETDVMVEAMQYGPFVHTYGTKLYNSAFNYESDMGQILDCMKKLEEREASLDKDKVPEDKYKSLVDEDLIPDDIDVATLLRATLLEESTSLPSSEDNIHKWNELQAEALGEIKRTLTESPASKAFVTISERVAIVASNNREPQYYTAPSSPVQTESTQAPVEPVNKSTKSKLNQSNRPLEPQYIPEKPEVIQVTEESNSKSTEQGKKNVSSPEPQYVATPEITESILAPEESVTKSTKSGRKKSSKSPRPQYVTAPSSPTMVKSKVLSESPQAFKEASAKSTLKSTPSPKQPARPPPGSLSLPNNEIDRKKFLLNAYDKRMTKQLAFMAAIFELQNTIGNKKGLKELVNQQSWFEKKWLSESGVTKKDDEESISGAAIEQRETRMLDDVFHGQALLDVLWRIYEARENP